MVFKCSCGNSKVFESKTSVKTSFLVYFMLLIDLFLYKKNQEVKNLMFNSRNTFKIFKK